MTKCLDAVIRRIGIVTNVEEQMAALLCGAGYHSSDIVEIILYARWRTFKRELEKLLGRPLTNDELDQAKRLFKQGKKADQAAIEISASRKPASLPKPKI